MRWTSALAWALERDAPQLVVVFVVPHEKQDGREVPACPDDALAGVRSVGRQVDRLAARRQVRAEHLRARHPVAGRSFGPLDEPAAPAERADRGRYAVAARTAAP